MFLFTINSDTHVILIFRFYNYSIIKIVTIKEVLVVLNYPKFQQKFLSHIFTHFQHKHKSLLCGRIENQQRNFMFDTLRFAETFFTIFNSFTFIHTTPSKKSKKSDSATNNPERCRIRATPMPTKYYNPKNKKTT